MMLFPEEEHVALDFVSDVRNHLYSFSQVVSFALFLNHALIDSTRCDIVVACRVNTREAFIVS